MSKSKRSLGPRLAVAMSCAAALIAMAGLTLVSPGIVSGGSNPGPDVIVFNVSGTTNHGSSGGFRGYSIGTTSCNLGNQPLWWCNDAGDTFCNVNQHPVIAQNMFRLKDGRFEQIGMSWLKHGFTSLNSPNAECGTCVQPPHGGDQLGVGCTDPYGSSLNGSRPLGLRSEVNATTGDFPYPYTNVGSSAPYEQRVKVLETELDPALNAGARYFIEGHYIAADDAAAGNDANNASYREVSVNAGTFNLTLVGNTVRQEPAIFAWKAVDPNVEILTLKVPGKFNETFHAARKVTSLGGGMFHYEYALHNLNSDRSARSFTAQFPGATNFSNVGFRDVDHHSGEPYDTTDWAVSMDTGAGTLSWSTDDFATNPTANALRWGTMFSFWFDADRGPADLENSFGIYKAGLGDTVTFAFFGGFFQDGFESGNTAAWSATDPP
ncbi:MAG: hypothetical protein KDD47_03095 [Acidobacteria bacterium]|nr:hypothetical protein [Acidobacteriota bacterium]